MPKEEIKVGLQDKGRRLDKYLSLVLPDFSRTAIQELIKQNNVRVNSKARPSSYRVKEGDSIDVTWLKKEPPAIALTPLDVSVIFDDPDLMVVDKPQGLIVHPAGKNKDSLIGCLLYKGIELSSVSSLRPGVVHRLDKDTSGVMVIAKNNRTHLYLVNEFRERRVEKEYLAVVGGLLDKKEGKIDLPLARLKHEPKMKVSFLGSKQAFTAYKVLKESKGLSLLLLKPRTGRMHQLRVHLAYLGVPILGDKKYKGPAAMSLMLHSRKLAFIHPKSRKLIEFSSPAPKRFSNYFPGI